MVKGKGPSFLAPLIFYHAANDGMLAAMSAVYPILLTTKGFGLNYGDIGLLTSLGLVVTILFQIMAGKVGDSRDTQYVMAGGILILGISSFLVTRSYDFITLLSVSLLLRVGASFYHPVGIGWISKRYTGNDLDRSMGYQSAVGDAGVLISFLTTGLIAIHWGWQAPFYIWGAANIVAIVVGMARRYDVTVQEPAGGARKRVPMSRLFKTFRFSLVPLALTGAAYTITTNFGPLLITDPDAFGMSADIAGLVIALWIGTGVVSATFFGQICSLLGRYRTIILCFVVMVVASAVIGLTDDFVVICIMMVIFGFFLFITWPGLFAMISEATGKLSQGFTFGIIFAGQIVGGASIAYVAGYAAEMYGIHTPFLILSAVMVLPIVSLSLYKPIEHKPVCR